MRLRRITPIAMALLVGTVGSAVIRQSVDLAGDTSLFVAGFVIAWLISPRKAWSWSLMLRWLASAYFFRCIFLYLVGNHLVKVVATGDAVLGLAAVAAAKLFGLVAGTDPQEEACSTRQLGTEAVACGADAVATAGASERQSSFSAEQTGPWSRPQFRLRALFAVTGGCASLLAVGTSFGPGAAELALLLGLIWWFSAACHRLLKLGAG